MAMKVLATGGAGFIGSHTTVSLLEAGHDVVILDNLSNAKAEVLNRIERIAGKRPAFDSGDVRDPQALDRVFREHDVDAVIHFAGLKTVSESVQDPLVYYENNVAGSICLLGAMREHGLRNLVFSSSCTVYGSAEIMPITEDFPTGATVNAYGRSKYMVEEVLRDLQAADDTWNIALLRYFNPVGAHESGLIGEDPVGVPDNLVPYIAQVACGTQPSLRVFGGDYPTRDGTCVRDYVHVVDVALGHLRALDKLAEGPGLVTYNLGTGVGSTVLEVVKAFEKACGRTLPFEIVDRRDGDVREAYADASKAERELGWKATREIEASCADSWRWQSANPRGYD
jgi:UDP-glucose 4-epimerase